MVISLQLARQLEWWTSGFLDRSTCTEVANSSALNGAPLARRTATTINAHIYQPMALTSPQVPFCDHFDGVNAGELSAQCLLNVCFRIVRSILLLEARSGRGAGFCSHGANDLAWAALWVGISS
eukprot:SAG31_NODE_3096_length_4680_cov_1.703995_7_plen_124_part_00